MKESIGALWTKQGKNGEFWSGSIELIKGEKTPITIFKNNYKKDKQPDFRIYLSQQKETYIPNDEQPIPPSELSDDLPF